MKNMDDLRNLFLQALQQETDYLKQRLPSHLFAIINGYLQGGGTKKEEPAAPVGFDVDPAIPKNLRDLMIADGVTEWDIQNLMSVWGYVDSQMPVRDYTKIVNDGVSIIDGFLVPQWADIRKEIQKMNDAEEIPFN